MITISFPKDHRRFVLCAAFKAQPFPQALSASLLDMNEYGLLFMIYQIFNLLRTIISS